MGADRGRIGSILAALIGGFFNCQITDQDNAEHPRSHAYPREHQAIQLINYYTRGERSYIRF